MKKYLISENGTFYKANLHCHSTISDGSLTVEQLKEAYKGHGYSVLAITDHERLHEHSDLNDENFLTITGYEISITEQPINPFLSKTCHLNFYAKNSDNTGFVCYDPKYAECEIPESSIKHRCERFYSTDCINEIIKTANENGFFVSYNHPHWSLETLEQYGKYKGMFAMEIFNHSSNVEGFDEHNGQVYDHMLRSGTKTFCIATDDNHNRRAFDDPAFDSFGGFTMIKAEKLSYASIVDSLLSGNFYASTGPEISALYMENGHVFIECPNAREIRFSTGGRQGEARYAKPGETLGGASFEVKDEYIYFRIEVKNEKGQTANTNAYFLNK